MSFHPGISDNLYPLLDDHPAIFYDLHQYILYYNENNLLDNEIVYLKADIFNENIIWYN